MGRAERRDMTSYIRHKLTLLVCILAFGGCAAAVDPSALDETSDQIVGGGADSTAPTFKAERCGTNTLESAGPTFANEICTGTLTPARGVAKNAIRITYTDRKVEHYVVVSSTTAGRGKRTVVVTLSGGRKQYTFTASQSGTGPFTDLSGTGAKNLPFSATLAAVPESAKIECKLTRRATVPGGVATLVGTTIVDNSEANDFQGGIDAWNGNYSFSLDAYTTKDHPAGELSVIFYENNHTQDEVGGLDCNIPKSGSFCTDVIKVDQNLGGEEDANGEVEEKNVIAFDFACKVL